MEKEWFVVVVFGFGMGIKMKKLKLNDEQLKAIVMRWNKLAKLSYWYLFLALFSYSAQLEALKIVLEMDKLKEGL